METNNVTTLQAATVDDIQLLAQRAEAQFAISPAGQMLKQFEISQRMGQMFSKATIVPDAYKGNVANCAVAVDMAMRMNMPPMMVMQNLYVVHGNPAWSTKFLIACVNGCGRFTPLDYKMKDNVAQDSDDYGCRCVAYAKGDVKREHPLYGPWVTWRMVKAEGWLQKNGSKWKTMPDLMFRYRAAALWQRLYAPELSMGLMTQEEVMDIQDVNYTEVRTAKGYEQRNAAFEVPAEDVAPAVSEERRKEATERLNRVRQSSVVRQIMEDYRDVYDADDNFRDALINKYEALQRVEQVMRSQAAAETEPTNENNNEQ